MKRLIFLLLLLPFFVNAQTQYNLNYDSIRVGRADSSGRIGLSGSVYLKKLQARSTAANLFLTRREDGLFQSRTPAQVLSDIGAASSSNVVTMTTNQTSGLTGNKTWSGTHNFNGTTQVNTALAINSSTAGYVNFLQPSSGTGLSTNQGSIIFTGAAGTNNFVMAYQDGATVKGGNLFFPIQSGGLFRSYTFPAASGTLALTSSTVSSITGTANQITASAATGDVTLSLPSTLIAPGTFTSTSTLTMPTPFTLGATSVTSTGTQLNYLNAATGTTGTTSTNLVFSTSPSLTTPNIGAATFTTLTGGTSSFISYANTGAGSVTEGLNIRNGGTTAGTGSYLRFRHSTSTNSAQINSNVETSGNANASLIIHTNNGTSLTEVSKFNSAGLFNTIGTSMNVGAAYAVALTFPTSSGTLATLAGTETFSNKTFSNSITSSMTSGDLLVATAAGTGSKILNIGSTGSSLVVGTNNSAGGNIMSTSAYASYIFTHNATDLVFGTNDAPRISLTSAGAINIPGLTASQLVQTDASKNLVSSLTLPNNTLATTQSASDNSTKVATTAYVDAATGGGLAISSNTFVPTFGGYSGCAVSVTNDGFRYQRIGNQVFFSGYASGDFTGGGIGGAFGFTLTVPVATANFSNVNQGNAVVTMNGGNYITSTGTATNGAQTISISGTLSGSSIYPIHIEGSYTIQ